MLVVKIAMSSRTQTALSPHTPIDEADRPGDLRTDQLRITSLSMHTAPEPAGLTDREDVKLINSENLELQHHMQQLQSQLKLQQVYQVRHTHLSSCFWQPGRAVCISCLHCLLVCTDRSCAAVELHLHLVRV